MSWNLSYTKSRTYTLPASPRQTHSRPDPCPVTMWQGLCGTHRQRANSKIFSSGEEKSEQSFPKNSRLQVFTNSFEKWKLILEAHCILTIISCWIELLSINYSYVYYTNFIVCGHWYTINPLCSPELNNLSMFSYLCHVESKWWLQSRVWWLQWSDEKRSSTYRWLLQQDIFLVGKITHHKILLMAVAWVNLNSSK